MAILEQIKNSTPYRLYANGELNTTSNRGSGIAELVLRVEIFNFKKIFFWPKNIWKFSRRSVVILQLMRNSTAFSLYANGSPEGALSNRGIAELILWVEIFNYEKIDFCPENLWKLSRRSVAILQHMRNSAQ